MLHIVNLRSEYRRRVHSLSEWNGGSQLLSLVNLAHLCENVDLLHGNRQDLSLLLILCKILDRVAEVLGSSQADLALC